MGEARDETELERLVREEDAPGHRELHRDVLRHQLAQRHRRAHVRDQTPFGLHHRELATRVRDAHVRAEGDLQAAAQADAMSRRDHGRRDLAPQVAHVLRQVGQLTLRTTEQLLEVRPGDHRAGDAAHVEARTKGTALARDHYGTHR